ncbi:MAG: hypothetical protein RI996_426 [Candidatus Parcubacteria bacterium]|jgi:hypothetical protein
MNTISIVYCPERFTQNHRIVAEQELLFAATPTQEVHLILLSPFAVTGEAVTKIGDRIWVYPCSTKNITLSIWSTLKRIRLIQKQDQFVKAPWTKTTMGSTFGQVYKQIDVVLTDEIVLSQIVGFYTARYFKAALSIVFIKDEFSFLRGNIFSSIRWIRTIFSRFLIKRAAAVSLGTALLENRYTKMYAYSPSILEKMHVLPKYIDFEALSHTEKTIDLHTKYPQFRFIIIVHTALLHRGDLKKCVEIIKGLKSHFDFAGFVVLGSVEPVYLDVLHIRASSYAKYFVFEGSSADFSRAPMSYFKSANLFLMRPDVYLYDTLLMYAFAATCPTVAIKTPEISSFFDGNDLFLVDTFEAAKIVDISMSIINSPATVKERVIAMKQGVSAMFGTMSVSYKEYLTALYNSFLFLEKK